MRFLLFAVCMVAMVVFSAGAQADGCKNGVCSMSSVAVHGPGVAKASSQYRDQFTVSKSRSVARTTLRKGAIKRWAKQEARSMAEHGTCGHVSSPPPGTFVGVGCNGQTCTGSGRLIATAKHKGRTVKVWSN